jgi:spermidine synthase
VQNFAAGLVCSLLALLAAGHPWRQRWSRGMLGAVTLLGMALVLATAWNHPHLLASRDTPYGRVTVTRADRQVAVFENDALAYESQGTAAEEFVHVAAVQLPEPQRVLLLGGGFQQLVQKLLLHRPARLDYVELNGRLLDLVTPHLPDQMRRSLSAKPVDVIVADPRRFLDASGSYDLILIGMPEPESGQSHRFYTREFFAVGSRRLAPDGVLALRLRGAENLWTPQLARRTASIHQALRSVFADVVVLPGATNVILASDGPLPRDPELLASRLIERGIEGQLVIPAYLRYLYTNDRFFEIAERLERTESPVNTDARPVCYQYTMLIWLSRFVLAAGLVELPELEAEALLVSPAVWGSMVLIAGALLWLRRRSVLRRSLLAAVAGLVGMVLEAILLLSFQSARGVLYQDLGLLLTMFMAGLALGATALDRWASRPAGLTRPTGGLLLLGLASLSGLLAWLLSVGAVASLWATSLLLLACGFLVAGLFAYASLHRRPNQIAAVSPVYAADLLGGSVGSLVASLVLIPVVGLAGSALFMIPVVLVSALLV